MLKKLLYFLTEYLIKRLKTKKSNFLKKLIWQNSHVDVSAHKKDTQVALTEQTGDCTI